MALQFIQRVALVGRHVSSWGSARRAPERPLLSSAIIDAKPVDGETDLTLDRDISGKLDGHPALIARGNAALVRERGSRIGRCRQVSGGRLLESRLAPAEVAQW
jgi:hypothetical protein